MDLPDILEGAAIGLSIAAPVGPIGALCIRRTLAEGRLMGFVTGLGAATADAIYGAVAGFGLTFITSFLLSQQAWLRVAGGAFLCVLGCRIFTASPALQAKDNATRGLASAYVSTLFLTLANPATILSFIGIFAGLGLGTRGPDYATATLFVLGVFLGSALWWLVLSTSVGVLRSRLTPGGLRWINRASGVIIVAFGVVALASAA